MNTPTSLPAMSAVRTLLLGFGLFAWIATSSYATSPIPWTNGQSSEYWLGTGQNQGGATGFVRATSVAIDAPHGKLYVADQDNNRVLRFTYPLTASIAAAEAVFGQSGLTSYLANRGGSVTANTLSNPYGLAVASNGDLWISDYGNNRVVKIVSAYSAGSGAAASVVLGQTDFTSSGYATTQTGLQHPAALSIDAAGNLWVADLSNHRVLRFASADTIGSGAAAAGVLGQADFFSNYANRAYPPGPAAADTLSGPYGLCTSGTTLWVCEANNNRVLRYDNAASKTDGAAADGVLGQADFTSSTANRGGSIADNTLSSPFGVAADAAGTLYVSDGFNTRVLIFTDAASKANGAAADNCLGATSFTAAGSLDTACGLAYDDTFHRLVVPVSLGGCVYQYLNYYTTTTALVSSQNPASVGASITFTATVTTADGGPTATGNVNFKEGSTALGSGALNGAGQATFSTSALSDGNHVIVAEYVRGSATSSSTTHNGSTSSPFTQVIGQYTPTITLISSANPSTIGDTVTFTATVEANPTWAPSPTGTVAFKVGGTTQSTPALSGGGTASWTTSALAAGNYTITAVYSGDASCRAVTSSGLSQTVNPLGVYTPLPATADVESDFDGTNTTVVTNFGDESVYAGLYAGTSFFAAFKFDLSSVSGTIAAAQLKVRVNGIGPQYTGGATSMNLIFSGSTDDSWVDTGGSVTAPASASTVTPALTTVASDTKGPDDWIVFDVTSFVQAQMAVGDKKASFVVNSDTTGDNYVGFYSRECADASSQPILALVVVPPPAVTSVSPTSGPTAGGTSVTLTGTTFTGATAVRFGATNASSYTVDSATQITAIAPAGSAGTVDITVTTTAGTSATGASDQFTYIAEPALSINDVTASEGNSGTTTFTFTISLSTPAQTGGVTFDIATADGTATTAGSDYVGKFLTSQAIPEGGSSYTFDVTVNGDYAVEPNETFTVNVTNVTGATVSDGSGTGTITNDDVAPTMTTSAISAIAATTATVDGDITATGGANATARGVIYWAYNDTDQVIGDAGVTNLAESGDFGTGAFTASLTGLSVNTQYNARAYATSSIGTGYGARVAFWTLANAPLAPTVSSPTDTTLDVTVNANGNPDSTEFCIQETTTGNYVQADGTLGAGPVWQTAATWGTTTVTGLTSGSTYTFQVTARNGDAIETDYSSTTSVAAVAVVTSVTSSGSTAGGSSVTIIGTGFNGATGVYFGSTAATSFTKNSDTSITAIVPAGTPGLVDVTVTTAGGTSATGTDDQFTYVDPVPTYSVTSTDDNGTGTLREAISVIASDGTITFDSSLSGETITLASPLTLARNMNIDGTALDAHVQISGDGQWTVFTSALGNTVVLAGLDIIDGNTPASAGGVFNAGTMTLRQCTVGSNTADIGGGLVNDGGVLTLQGCTVSDNTAGLGGGLVNEGGVMILQGCTISGNSASLVGGIFNTGTLTIKNCTLAGNQATMVAGGALFQQGPGATATLNHCTVVGNTAAGQDETSGLDVEEGALTLVNSIVANNGAGGTSNFQLGSGGTISSLGYNLCNDWNGQPTTTDDLTGDPVLADLADNGGPTQTCALPVGSPARDAADPADPTATDQRGVSRPQDGISDIGAYEAVPDIVSVDVPSAGIYDAGQPLDFTVNFVRNVAVDTSGGTPRIALNIGGTTVYADYLSGSGSTALAFEYVVQPGDTDSDGIEVGSAIDPNGSLIFAEADGNPVTLVLIGVASTVGIEVGTATITAVSPSIGRTDGGQTVTITGTGFTGATGVSFGATAAASFSVNDDTTITATAPAGSVGVVDVTVTNAGGTSATVSEDQFTYVVAPTTYTVTSLDENGEGSLREAISLIADGGTITLDSSLSWETIILSSPLAISRNLTIDGSAAEPHVQISGDGSNTVFEIAGGATVTLAHLDIVDGYGDFAGGIYNQGTLTVKNCSIYNNSGEGSGGIYNEGTLSIENSTISDNSGGAISNDYTGTLTMLNSTVSSNQGGGINFGAITNSGQFAVNHCTIANNTDADIGFDIEAGTLTLKNSIVANNGAGETSNFQLGSGGTLTSQGYNLSNDWNSQTLTTGDLTADPMLDALADNGGDTQTCALQAGSPALNAAGPDEPHATDQRGFSRPQYGISDIGAYETLDPTPVITTGGGVPSVTHNAPPVAVDPLLTVTGNLPFANASVSIDNFKTGDVLSYDNAALPPSGAVTGSWDSTTGVLTFSGSGSASPADWQALLRTVKMATASGDITTRTVTFNAGNARCFAGNGHFYEYVSSAALGWVASRDAAATHAYFGLQGYLVTVTSAGENAFVDQLLSTHTSWLGATDVATEGTWLWVTGPEGLENAGAGRHFFTQTWYGGDVVGGFYNHWNSGEPNNNDTGEDYADFKSDGTWNDLPSSTTVSGYVVEYGGMPGDPVVSLAATTSVTVIMPPPTVTAISPSSGALASGKTVTITGTNFAGASAVKFGALAAGSFSVVSGSDTSITAKAPIVEAAGTVDITVTTAGGTSVTSVDDQFTYTLPPPPIVVINNADSGVGSLRAAIASVDSGGSIILDASLAGQTITLSSLFEISKNITIDGSSAEPHVKISGNGGTIVFYIDTGVTVTLAHLDIIDGNDVYAGGIYNGGTLTLKNCSVNHNSGMYAGGIYNRGILTVENSTISDNGGGAIRNDSSSILTMLNSTVSGNLSGGFSSGAITNYGQATINHCTIANNTDTYCGFDIEMGTLTLKNSIVANNGADGTSNIYGGTFTSQGYNLCNDWNGQTKTTGDLTGNPLLAALADNGGDTQTCALLVGSPARDAADLADPTATDQRGIARPQFGRSDIGAYEAVPDIVSVDVPSGGLYSAGQALDFTVHFGNDVLVVGRTPRIALTIGGNTVYANYLSGSGTNALVFEYMVQSGDTDLDGITVGGSIDLHGGTIFNEADGNPVTLVLIGVASTGGINVGAAPAITTDPTPQTVTAGATATFTAAVSGNPAPTYKWQRSPLGSGSWFDLSDNATYGGATTDTLTVVTTLAMNTDTFRCVATNSVSSAISAAATLSVTSLAYTAPTSDGYGATASGGGTTSPVVVLTATDFKTQAESSTPCVITVAGTLYIGTVNVASDKTIQGADANATLVGNLALGAGVSNVVIRGLHLTNPGPAMIPTARTADMTFSGRAPGGDALTIAGASNVFVNHCTFFDNAGHDIEIVSGSDDITVSWCEFYNSSAPVTPSASVLIGTTTESQPLHVTLHHNWWSANVGQHMPFASYGYVHMYSNYFASAGNTAGSVASDRSQFFSELNVYSGMASPLYKQNVDTTLAAGKIRVIGNVYTSCTGTAPDAGTDAVFTPAYSYEMLPASDVATEVAALAGNIDGAATTDATPGSAAITGPTAAVTPGTAFTLTAVPAGFTPVSGAYQWRLNNMEIAGATSETYTSSNTQAANVGTYTVAISLASEDTVVSTPFVVTLGAPAPTVTTSGGGGGGGSFEVWFCAALALLGSLHLLRRRSR